MTSNFMLYVTLSLSVLLISTTNTATASPVSKGDSHYNEVGFFDIHVCNWPNRPLFFMLIFSSYEYKNIKAINVYTPENTLLKKLSLDKFKLILKNNKPEKRAFINQVEIQNNYSNGWYRSY